MVVFYFAPTADLILFRKQVGKTSVSVVAPLRFPRRHVCAEGIWLGLPGMIHRPFGRCFY